MDGIINGLDTIKVIEDAIRYTKLHSADIAVLLVINMKTYDGYRNQYDITTEYFSEDELSDYLEALDSLGIYHDVSYGEDEFLQKIVSGYFEKFNHRFKIVFNTTGSKRIRSRSTLIPAVCEMIGLQYASNDIWTCSILENKVHANSLLSHYGFPIPSSWFFYPNHGWMNGKPPIDRKLIIKPGEESASIGITQKSVGYFSEEFEKMVYEVCHTLNEPVIVQEFINGWEVEVPILDLGKIIPLPPMGVELSKNKSLNDQFLSFDMVFSDNYDYYRFDDINHELSETLKQIAKKSYHFLELQGTVRVDFRVKSTGQCFISDYNNSPHLTRFHSVAKSLISLGFQYDDLFCLLLFNSLKRNDAKNHSIFASRKTNRLF